MSKLWHPRLFTAVGAIAAMLMVLLVPPSPGAVKAQAAPSRPNIVFVLTDDLAWNLVTQQFMPHLVALEGQGATFTDYFVSDSLCCPSRASIFTGRLPHDTGVYDNTGPNGGDKAFNAHGDQYSTIATDLSALGYRTAMMGKYLNRYHMSTPTPPGWGNWDVADWGYPEFNYTLKQDNQVVHYGGPNQSGKDNYLTDVLSGLGDQFVTSMASKHPSQPFFLEVATFAPHAPYTPAPKYANLYPGLTYPKTPAYGTANTAAPEWLKDFPPLGLKAQAEIASAFRLRAQDVKSVDDLIANLVSTLRRTGALSHTYFVFSSDNGLHMGEHDMMPGKLTAFDTDVRVPLIVVGPRITAGSRISGFAENIDLRSTFDALAGTEPKEGVDGRSLTPLLFKAKGTSAPPGWPQGALIEHMGPIEAGPDQPDKVEPNSGNPPSYIALRTSSALYVQYKDGAHEYYNLTKDPSELHNVYASLPAKVQAALEKEVARLEGCHDAFACSQVAAVP
jgi:N-acetylglucosamine-6-sulfatase